MTNEGTARNVIESSDTSLTVRRAFDAPRERVYRAFTDPAELAEWYAPGDMSARVDAFNPEVGGEFAVSMLGEDGSHDVEGTFTDVVEDERLVHTWRWVEGETGGESRVTVVFRDTDGGTEVELTHEALPDAESVERHVEGWTGIYDNLAAYL